jgi:hypothetical protein
MENGDNCIAARRDENQKCWGGGDKKHQDVADDAQKVRDDCAVELASRRDEGMIYECSDSTFASESHKVADACRSYGRGCQAWSMDPRPVDCNAIRDAMKQVDACIAAVEVLDRDCLPRLSHMRASQYRDALAAQGFCKNVLSYKQSRNLCK